MRLEVKAARVAMLLAAVGFLGWDYHRARTELAQAQEAVKTAQAALKRLQATSALRGNLRAATARETASRAAALEAAAASAPEWRDTPVPQEVQDALAQ